jgi:Domain of unknown function (DUF4124)
MNPFKRRDPMRAPTTIAAATIFIAAIAASTFTPAHATLYRWTDERGVVNYSDKTPPKNAAAKDVRVVPQDRLSIYSPDRATLDMVKLVRERGLFWPRYEVMPMSYSPMGPMAGPQDLCAYGDPSCNGSIYYGYPGNYGYHGRLGNRRFQPQLPLGATAGNVVGPNGYTAGLSAQAQTTAQGHGYTRSLPLARGAAGSGPGLGGGGVGGHGHGGGRSR